jgi:hypothetical protein
MMAEIDVNERFDAVTIALLSVAADLPPTADLARFGESVRTAARLYLVEQQRNPLAVRREIRNLYRLANKVMAGKSSPAALEAAVGDLAVGARQLLEYRALMIARLPAGHLPRPELPRSPEGVIELTRYGGGMKQGRARPNGRRSRPRFEPLLWEPPPLPGRPPNQAGRELVIGLGDAYLHATGRNSPRTADHRKPGPFARLVRGCLHRMGARHVNAVQLINTVGELRRDEPID